MYWNNVFLHGVWTGAYGHKSMPSLAMHGEMSRFAIVKFIHLFSPVIN